MRYVTSRFEEYTRDMAYRVYITDCLYETEEHKKVVLPGRFYNFLYPAEVDNRTGDEIAKDVIKNAGLVVGK